MKYPFVLFFRLEKYSYVDEFLKNNIEKLDCTIHVSDDPSDLNKLFNSTFYCILKMNIFFSYV